MTFARVCRSLQVDRVGQKGHDNVGQQKHCERGELALGRPNPHGKEEGPRWRGGRWGWRGWQHRANGWQRWVNK